MSSANCCLAQKPPSPNNLAPRLVPLPSSSEPPQAASQYGNISTNYPSSSSPSSPLSKPDDIAELQAIFEEDKSPIGDGNNYPKTKRSSASLTSVKNRLKKHLSRELKVQKRQSRSSVGTSEEEIERRAELRRIRQRRIQEELSNELGYDSDAKSLPTISGVDFAGEENGDGGSTRHRLPYPGKPALSPASEMSPYENERGLQLEARLYGISPSTGFASPQTTQSEYNVTDSSNIVNTPGTPHLRRHSSPSLASFGAVINSPKTDQQTKFTGPFSPIPSAPALKPQRLSSFLSKSSWRLSFASENRGAHLRSLSQDGPLTPQAEDTTSPQPINRWLRSQGLRSTSQALTWSDNNSTGALSASHSRSCSANHVDETEIPYDGTHLDDMIISQRLATCLQRSLPPQKLSNAEHGLNYHYPSCAGDTTDTSPTMRELPLMKNHPRDTNDNKPHSSVSGTKLLRDRDITRISRKSSIAVPELATSTTPLPSEVQESSSQLFSAQYLTPRAKSAPVPNSYDGSTEKDICLSSPCPLAITPYAEDGHQATGRLHHLVDDDIAGTWSQAVHINTHSKDKYISHNLILPYVHKMPSLRHSEHSGQVNKGLDVKAKGSLSLNTGKAFKNDITAKPYNTLPDQKEGYFNNWRERLKPVARRPKSDRRYPASWSKFSSHGRRERTESATVDDKVDHIDFAIAGIQDGEAVWYINERSNHLYHHEGDDHESHRIPAKNRFFERWEKKFKDKLHQVESVQTDVFLDRTRGRRGSLIPSLPVEYPELELLPGDRMTRAQIEAYANEQLEEEEMQRQKEELKAIFSTEIKRQGSLATQRPSKWDMEADNPKREPRAPESIELDNLTPTKSTAQRNEERKSRKKAARNALMPRSFMRAVNTRNASKSHPQLAGQEDINMNIEERLPGPVDNTTAGPSSSSKTLSVLNNSEQIVADLEKEHEEKHQEGIKTEIESSRFYGDCIINIAPDEVDYTESDKFEEPPKHAEKGIFGTWSPGDWEKYKNSAEAGAGAGADVWRPLSQGHLRKSTDDFHLELQKMEMLEREKALRIAQEAWGSEQ